MTSDARHDFDWILGRWRVTNRRLVARGDPAGTAWEAFGARAEVTPALGGWGHVDLLSSEAPPGGQPFEALTLRQYDPAADVWRIWWASSAAPGHLDEPVVGRWRDGRGVFECDGDVAGVPTRLRFTWTHDGDRSARWQQELSRDGGASWWLDWTMHLTR